MSAQEKQEIQSQPIDFGKWLFVLALLACMIFANSQYSQEYSGYVRALVAVLVVIIAAVIGLTTLQGKRFALLFKESVVEIKRVVWPTRQETMQTTLVVVAVVLVMSVLLWMLDWTLNYLVSVIIG